MRLKLQFEEGILGQERKIWIDSPALKTISELIDHIQDVFEIKNPLEAWLDDFYIHSSLNFDLFVHPSDILRIKKSVFEIQQPKMKPLKDYNSKIRSKAHRKEMKKNPKATEFLGKKFKFSSDGRLTEVVPVVQPMKILSPAEEFDKKKSEWKIKPIPKRKAKNISAPEVLSTSCVLLPHELEKGQKISFSTKDSAIVKRGIVAKVEEKSVSISVMESFDPENMIDCKIITISKGTFREIIKYNN